MADSEQRDAVTRAFLEQWRRDQGAGIHRELGDYLARFPGHDDAIARAFLRLRHEEQSDRDETSIGPYRTSHEIGRGGQGVVYRARHAELGHDVALKVLRGLGPGSGHLIERFHREARVAARLNHPGICQVVDAGIENGVPFMAMQFIEGETLEERIERARGGTAATSSADETRVLDAPEPQAPPSGSASAMSASSSSSSVGRDAITELLKLFEKAARALHEAHRAGVVHRDIKPANIMVRPDGDPVLLDFGLARSEDDDLQTLTATGDLFGTPAYMSPEQLSAQAVRLDARTDVWSLGVALYESLALCRPFDAPTREGLYQAILTREAPPLRRVAPSVSRDLAIVVAKAIEKDRERRYGTAEELADELKRVRKRQPIVARPVGPVTRSTRWAQRNPIVAGLLATVILVLSGATVVTANEARRAEDALADRTRALEAEQAAVEEKDGALQARTTALAEKSSALAEYERLADAKRLAKARADADRLWPVTPELVDELRNWERDHATLLAPTTLAGHAASLDRLREQAEPYAEDARRRDFATEFRQIEALQNEESELSERVATDAASGSAKETAERLRAVREELVGLRERTRGRRSWTFANADDAFRHEILAQLVADLRAFTADDGANERQSIAERLVRAERIDLLTRTSEQASVRWQEAIARIAANDRYRATEELRKALSEDPLFARLHDASGALKLEPQIGLLPLGPDPTSGLEEFLHLGTQDQDWGSDTVALPERRARTEDDPRGGFAMSENTGVILVLVPPAILLMGTQAEDPQQANHDPASQADEQPVHEVPLNAFFISKYEMHQGQWAEGTASMVGVNGTPSAYAPGMFEGQTIVMPQAMDRTHPVDSVSWTEAQRVLERLGLTLPTEARWERAARADRRNDNWAGVATIGELARIANISGEETVAPAMDWMRTVEHRDAYLLHAPVGTYEANGFSLHDMTGNVWEWSRDARANYDQPARIGDGWRGTSGDGQIARGGAFSSPASDARVGSRFAAPRSTSNPSLGIRPARDIEVR